MSLAPGLENWYQELGRLGLRLLWKQQHLEREGGGERKRGREKGREGKRKRGRKGKKGGGGEEES